MTEKF